MSFDPEAGYTLATRFGSYWMIEMLRRSTHRDGRVLSDAQMLHYSSQCTEAACNC
jgi:hypothetical protein